VLTQLQLSELLWYLELSQLWQLNYFVINSNPTEIKYKGVTAILSFG